jgi:steroid 5-alpha reductase family enzyme
MDNIFEMLGASFFLVMTLMSLLWVVFYFKKNAGIADIGWAAGFVLSSWAYFFLGNGNTAKKLALVVMVSVWGIRLAWQLYQRFIAIVEEDSRYQTLRQTWGSENSDFKFFMLFIFQGVLVIFLTAPFLIVCSYASPGWQGVEIVGMLIWLIGVVGEIISDNQLYQFKTLPENKGKVFKEGFWYFSRHPNYFFEFVVWIGYAVFALGTPGGWIGLFAAGLMLILLTKVSGIPLSEAQTLKTKGQEYQKYQESTSSFIPWFPKK